jgi:uncharacterized protein
MADNDDEDLSHLVDAEKSSNKVPQRTCLVTRRVQDANLMLRFVLSPDGVAVPDVDQKLPGRGVWITLQHTLLAQALTRKVFFKAFRQSVTVDPDLVNTVRRLLTERFRQALGIANKAGCVVSGTFAVEQLLRKNKGIALLHSDAASLEGCRKLNALAGTLPVWPIADADLQKILNSTNTMHIGIRAGAGSVAVMRAWQRLQMFEQGRQ